MWLRLKRISFGYLTGIMLNAYSQETEKKILKMFD